MALTKVFKRDGRITVFDPSKVRIAVSNAFKVAKKDGEDARIIGEQAVLRLDRRFENIVPKVEEIDELILTVLNDYGFPEVAEAFSKFKEKKSKSKKAVKGEKRELGMSSNALAVLKSRYLKKNDKGEIVESPSDLFARVANNIA